MIKPLPYFTSRFTLLLLFSLFLSFSAGAQTATNKGMDFWLAYAGQADNVNSRMDLYVTAEVNTSAAVTIGGVAVAGSPFALKAGETTVVPVDPGAAHVFSSGQAENKGIHVTAAAPIVVYAHIHFGARARSSATLVLPAPALGQDYYSFNYSQPTNLPATENIASELTVVATENNTVVQITPAAPTRNNQPALAPFKVTLQAGQVYQVQSDSDLTGSRITTRVPENTACKRIAVFSGSTYVRFGCPAALTTENLYQQAYPVHTWGKSYTTMPFATRPADIFRILVAEDNTRVWVDGSPTDVPYKGTFFEVNRSAAAVIRADKPIAVAQYATAQNCDVRNTNQNSPAFPADMDMLVLNPTEQGLRETRFPAAYFGKTATATNARQYLNVVVKTSAAASFTINGHKPAGSFSPVGSSGFSFLQENITAAVRAHPVVVLQAAAEFNATTYWYGTQESYAYSAGTGVKDLTAYLHPLAGSPVCAQTPVHFNFTLPYQPERLTWDFGDGTPPVVQSDLAARVSPDHIYQTGGPFQVKLTIAKPAGTSCTAAEVLTLDHSILPAPRAAFAAVSAACVNTPVTFTDQSSAGSGQVMQWAWDFGDGQTAATASPSHTFSRPGTYPVQLTVTTDQGCTNKITTSLQVNAVSQAQAGPDQLSLCGVTSTVLQAVAPAAGTGSWSVVSGPAGTFSNAGDARATFSGPAGATYTLRWTVGNAPCPEAADDVQVRFNASPQASAGPDQEIIRRESVTLAGSGAGTYSWFPATGLSSSTVANPVATPAVTTTYELTVASPEGCIDKASVTVWVLDKLRVPTAFSPNEDRINDTWLIEGIAGYTRATIEVFDRWGNRVFSGGPEKAWDGKYQGRTLPMATYYYIINQNNGDKPLSGHISIVK
jgi:gliding motility-associated-like protein